MSGAQWTQFGQGSSFEPSHGSVTARIESRSQLVNLLPEILVTQVTQALKHHSTFHLEVVVLLSNSNSPNLRFGTQNRCSSSNHYQYSLPFQSKMLQIIEGIGNEVTLIFFLLSAAAAVALPWYFLGPPSASQEQVDSARPGTGSRPTVPVEETSAQQRLTNEFDARNCGDVSQFPTDLEDRTGQEALTNTTADSAGNNYNADDRALFVDRREDQHTFTTNTNTNHGTSTPREADIALKIKLHEQDQNVTVSKTMTLANLKRFVGIYIPSYSNITRKLQFTHIEIL